MNLTWRADDICTTIPTQGQESLYIHNRAANAKNYHCTGYNPTTLLKPPQDPPPPKGPLPPARVCPSVPPSRDGWHRVLLSISCQTLGTSKIKIIKIRDKMS